MRQAWLRKKLVDDLIDDVVSGDLPIVEATEAIHTFILGISLHPISANEKILLKVIVQGVLELVGDGSMDKTRGSNYILRLAHLSKTGERLSF